MQKILTLALFLTFAVSAYAQEYKFPLEYVDALDINMNKGRLYVRSAVDDKNLSITIFPEKPEALKKKITLEDGKVKADFDNAYIDKDTIITIKAPLRANLKIKSVEAGVTVSNMAGSLSLDAAAGDVKIDNFKGKLDICSADAEVFARGIFDELKIETAKGAVSIKIDELPREYKYEVKGSGNVVVDPGRKIKRGRKLIIEKDKAFSGKLEIKQR